MKQPKPLFKNWLEGASATGCLVRAITYPVISAEFDLSLRELNALATLSHINHEAGLASGMTEGIELEGFGRVIDTFDAMMLWPGMSQSFWEEEQFVEAVNSLEGKGLVTTQSTYGKRLLGPVKGEAEGAGRVAVLTSKGEDLIAAMAGNLQNGIQSIVK